MFCLVWPQRYLECPTVMHSILNDLYILLRYKTCTDLKQALDICLLAMDRYIEEKNIQISASASLYYLVKSNNLRKDWNLKIKKKILSTLLTGMMTHKTDHILRRNGCLIVGLFRVPVDILFEYERLAQILLFIVENNETDIFTQQSQCCSWTPWVGRWTLSRSSCLAAWGPWRSWWRESLRSLTKGFVMLWWS